MSDPVLIFSTTQRDHVTGRIMVHELWDDAPDTPPGDKQPFALFPGLMLEKKILIGKARVVIREMPID